MRFPYLFIFMGIISGSVIFTVYRYGIDTTRLKDPLNRRPYLDNSAWNTPIGVSPQYDPHSAEMVATIGLSAEGKITSDPTQFSYPVYFINHETSRWDIPCTVYSCTIVTRDGVERTDLLTNVPIPEAARPSQGHDAQMIIIDLDTNKEYDLWQVKRLDDGWEISNGSVYNISWDGMPAEYGSRGAGVPYLAGLIRPWEIFQGRIEHAIAFGYPNPAKGKCVFPASKTDGQSRLPYAIPEGARLQLDPTLTEDDFNKMGLDRTGKIIARTLQEYGMILIDYAGRSKIYPEDRINNPYSPYQWSHPRLKLTDETIANIPYQYFKVLSLPDAYWDPKAEPELFGDCYTH